MGILTRTLTMVPGIGKALAKSDRPAASLAAPQFSQMLVGASMWARQSHIRAYGDIGWLFAAVSKIADTVATTRWHLYQRTGPGLDDRDPVYDHPLLTLLHSPNPYSRRQSQHEFMFLSQLFLELVGEAPWWIGRNQLGEPVELLALNPLYLDVVPSKETFIAGYVYSVMGAAPVPLERGEVIFHKLPNPSNEYRGLGPVAAIMPELEAERYAVLWNRNYFLNSAEPEGVIMVPGQLSEAQFSRLMSQWNEKHRGVANAHRVGILEGDAKYQITAHSMRDMQFKDLRRVNRDTILGAFGIPVTILGLSEGVNRANMDASLYHYGANVIRPRLERIKVKLNFELVPLFGEGLELDYEDPTPGDHIAKQQAADSAFIHNYITLNEARALVGQYPDPALGDSYQWQIIPRLGNTLDANPDNPILPAEIKPPSANSDTAVPTSEVPKPETPSTGPVRDAYQNGVTKTTKVTRATPPDRYATWKAFDARAKAQEGNFVTAISGFFENQLNLLETLLQAMINENMPPAMVLAGLSALWESEEWAKQDAILAETTQPLALEALEAEADAVIDQYSLGIAFDVENPRVNDWIGQRMARYSAINQTTQEAITAELQEGYADGEGIADMLERVRGVYVEATTSRAETIARTEIISASNAGALEAYREAGVEGKRWLATMDDRTRDAHVEADGQEVGIDEQFYVGDEWLDGPGQGDLPENNINCRCTITPVRVQAESYHRRGYNARCPGCNRLLAKDVTRAVLRCSRCKREYRFTADWKAGRLTSEQQA